METKKYCFKSDGTEERGAKIIKALEKLGGKLPQKSMPWSGQLSNCYYFVDASGIFENSYKIPKEYQVVEPDDILKEKTFPREMYVSDKSEEEAISSKRKVTVHCILEDPRVGKQYIGVFDISDYFTGFRYAVEIPKEEEEPILELTLDQIAKKFNVSVDKIKIKK